MYKVETKIFVVDSKRPMWLINLLLRVNYWLTNNNLDTKAQAKSFLMDLIEETQYVRRKDIQSLINFVRIEESDDTISIYTLFKDKIMVEFKIVEAQ